MREVSDEILRTIKYALDRKKIRCDRTYQTIIVDIVKKGYVILDECGCERTVQCSIPGLELRVFQSVWVKEPRVNLNELHICGVAVKRYKGRR